MGPTIGAGKITVRFRAGFRHLTQRRCKPSVTPLPLPTLGARRGERWAIMDLPDLPVAFNRARKDPDDLCSGGSERVSGTWRSRCAAACQRDQDRPAALHHHTALVAAFAQL